MNVFNVGEKVIFIKPNHYLTNEEGVIVEVDLMFCTVEFKGLGLIHCDFDTIEIATRLPKGNQLSLSESNKCDCGGYKVYGSDNPMMHSAWCSSLK